MGEGDREAGKEEGQGKEMGRIRCAEEPRGREPRGRDGEKRVKRTEWGEGERGRRGEKGRRERERKGWEGEEGTAGEHRVGRTMEEEGE